MLALVGRGRSTWRGHQYSLALPRPAMLYAGPADVRVPAMGRDRRERPPLPAASWLWLRSRAARAARRLIS